MELAQGGDVFNYIESKRTLYEVDVKNIIVQLLDALYYMHYNNIVHCDLKPSNILIKNPNPVSTINDTPGCYVPHVLLCDFGTAVAYNRTLD